MMNKLLFLLLFVSFNGFSGWQLQPDNSSVSFVSTKQSHVREVHQITSLETNIVNEKQVSIRLDLSSIESGIPIRNERMRNMLFDVTNFRYAHMSLTLSKSISDYKTTTAEKVVATLRLKGKETSIPVELLIIPSGNGITATLMKPIIINAGQFGLTKGVDALREIAGLTSIGYSVPVSATISLVKK